MSHQNYEAPAAASITPKLMAMHVRNANKVFIPLHARGEAYAVYTELPKCEVIRILPALITPVGWCPDSAHLSDPETGDIIENLKAGQSYDLYL